MKTIHCASKFVWTAGMVCCLQTLTNITTTAQSAEGTPAPSNIGQSGYPRILSDNRIVFQVRAPGASQVQINLGRNYDMKKDDSGVWTVTTAPQDAGFHYYSLVIDGVSVSDPASQSFFGTGRMSSAIEIPESGVDFYTPKAVPHGDLRSKRYFSKATGSWRRLFVYTPPGYEKGSKKYPVLYIQHGGGEDETGWAVQGRTDIILDNLIAGGKATPMLVVIANGNVTAPGGARGRAGGAGGAGAGGYSAAGMAGFADELLNNIVPFVESNYRVKTGAKDRALAGLSMGGGQAYFVGLGHKDKFGSVGVFSTGLFGGISQTGAQPFNAEDQMPGILTDAKSFNKSLKVFYISVGEQDPRLEPTKTAVANFKSHGLKVEFASFPGGHEWQVWRKSLHDFAQRLFN
jgi:enterochelin esterase-like enzyme